MADCLTNMHEALNQKQGQIQELLWYSEHWTSTFQPGSPSIKAVDRCVNSNPGNVICQVHHIRNFPIPFVYLRPWLITIAIVDMRVKLCMWACNPGCQVAPVTYLGDAQPYSRVPPRVVEANLDVFGLVGVQVKVLVAERRAAGRDCAVVVTVVKNVQCSCVLIPLVEGNTHPDNVLGFLEGVRDAASIVFIRAVKEITSARPTRVSPDVVVPGVGGYATVRAAAAARRPGVVPIGVDVDPSPLASVDEGYEGRGDRRATGRGTRMR